MSVQNIVNINESNLQQTLEQSMTTPVLFYFWSERSQHRSSAINRQCWKVCRPVPRSVYSGKAGLRRAEQMIAARLVCCHPDSVYLNEYKPVDGFRPQPEEAIRRL